MRQPLTLARVLALPPAELDIEVENRIFQDNLKVRNTAETVSLINLLVQCDRGLDRWTVTFAPPGIKGIFITQIEKEDAFYKGDPMTKEGVLAWYWENRKGRDYQECLEAEVNAYQRPARNFCTDGNALAELKAAMFKRGFQFCHVKNTEYHSPTQQGKVHYATFDRTKIWSPALETYQNANSEGRAVVMAALEADWIVSRDGAVS